MALRKSRKIVSLRGAAIPLPQVNRDVVETLEMLVQRAKSGEVVGLIYGCVSPRGHISTGWAGNGGSHDMMAAASMLNHRVLTAGVDKDS